MLAPLGNDYFVADVHVMKANGTSNGIRGYGGNDIVVPRFQRSDFQLTIFPLFDSLIRNGLKNSDERIEGGGGGGWGWWGGS